MIKPISGDCRSPGGRWHALRFMAVMKCNEPFAGQQAATRIDLRNSMDFFCMLKTCALIKRLGPGECVHVLANDRNFLADLRRIHPDCAFETVSCVMGFEEDADYLVRVSRRTPTSDNH